VISSRLVTGRHLSRRPDRQFQHPAQRRQVLVARPNVIVLPEVNGLDTDANLFRDFGNRQAALDTSVSEMATETGLAGQWAVLPVLVVAAYQRSIRSTSWCDKYRKEIHMRLIEFADPKDYTPPAAEVDEFLKKFVRPWAGRSVDDLALSVPHNRKPTPIEQRKLVDAL
jgi:hypothetical protein